MSEMRSEKFRVSAVGKMDELKSGPNLGLNLGLKLGLPPSLTPGLNLGLNLGLSFGNSLGLNWPRLGPDLA